MTEEVRKCPACGRSTARSPHGVLCLECHRSRQRTEARKSYGILALVALAIAGFFATTEYFGADDPSEWCQAAEDVAEGPGSVLIANAGVEETVGILAQQYSAWQATSPPATAEIIAQAMPAPYSSFDVETRLRARRQLGDWVRMDCGFAPDL